MTTTTRTRRSRRPLARTWTRAGFSRDEFDRWRAAGWVDAEQAAAWRAAAPASSPVALQRLADLGYQPEQIDHVRSLVGVGAPAWTSVLLPLETDATAPAPDLWS